MTSSKIGYFSIVFNFETLFRPIGAPLTLDAPVDEEHLAVVPPLIGLGDVGDVEARKAEVGAGRVVRVDLGHAATVVLVRVGRVVVVPDGGKMK